MGLPRLKEAKPKRNPFTTEWNVLRIGRFLSGVILRMEHSPPKPPFISP